MGMINIDAIDRFLANIKQECINDQAVPVIVIMGKNVDNYFTTSLIASEGIKEADAIAVLQDLLDRYNFASRHNHIPD